MSGAHVSAQALVQVRLFLSLFAPDPLLVRLCGGELTLLSSGDVVVVVVALLVKGVLQAVPNCEMELCTNLLLFVNFGLLVFAKVPEWRSVWLVHSDVHGPGCG